MEVLTAAVATDVAAIGVTGLSHGTDGACGRMRTPTQHLTRVKWCHGCLPAHQGATAAAGAGGQWPMAGLACTIVPQHHLNRLIRDKTKGHVLKFQEAADRTLSSQEGL